MAVVAGIDVETGWGGVEETLAALHAQEGRPRSLPAQPLIERLQASGARCLQGRQPDVILLATTKGDCVQYADALVDEPGRDGRDLPGSPARLALELSARFECPAWAVCGACASGPIALAQAGRMLRDGLARRVLVLGGDRLAPFVSDGFASLRALSPTSCRPFDGERDGLQLGEAVAAMVLEDGSFDADPAAVHLRGWGASLDANHLTGPTRDGSGLARCLRSALASAEILAPDWIIGHGTATRYNDDSESLAYATACPAVPVVGWKGMLGHSLGTCGVLEVALGCHLLRADGLVPGTVNCRHAGTAGTIPLLATGSHPLPGPCFLSANAGFGGLNAAVVMDGHPAAPASPEPVSGSRWMDVSLHPTGWTVRTAEGAVLIEGTLPAAEGAVGLPALTAKQVTGRIDASWGRMDRAARALTTLVLKARAVVGIPDEAALVLVSASGSAASDRIFEQRRRGGEADPQNFVYTLPSAPVGEASIRGGITGPGFVLMGASLDEAVRACVDGLLRDGCPAVLVARVDCDLAGESAELQVHATSEPERLPTGKRH